MLQQQVQNYHQLLSKYTSGELSTDEFDMQFINLFKNTNHISKVLYQLAEKMFFLLEDYSDETATETNIKLFASMALESLEQHFINTVF